MINTNHCKRSTALLNIKKYSAFLSHEICLIVPLITKYSKEEDAIYIHYTVRSALKHKLHAYVFMSGIIKRICVIKSHYIFLPLECAVLIEEGKTLKGKVIFLILRLYD